MTKITQTPDKFIDKNGVVKLFRFVKIRYSGSDVISEVGLKFDF